MWSPPDLGIGVEGGSADVAGRQEGGGRFGKWMGACWFWRAPKIMGARPHSERAPKNNGGAPSSCGRFGDFLLFFIAAKS